MVVRMKARHDLSTSPRRLPTNRARNEFHESVIPLGLDGPVIMYSRRCAMVTTGRTTDGAPLFGWRSALLALTAVVPIAKTLAGFAAIVAQYLVIQYDVWFELGMVIGQVLFQWSVLWRRTWNERLQYAVALVLVSALGSVLLWPLLLWHTVATVSPLVAVLYFFAVVGIMFGVHWRVVLRLALPTIVCATWVLYRLVILFVVLKRP